MKLISTHIYTKLVFALYFSIVFSQKAISQNIPDANFAAAIRAACPTCIDGSNNLLLPAASLINLDVSGKNISNLTGIGGFTGLQTLNCSENQLTNLPNLPSGISDLNCNQNQLAGLPALPTGLTVLSCDNNLITGLPALPSSLSLLFCQNNQLISLPVLPNNLTDLYCINNQLTTLPTLPNNLIKIECRGNQLTSLPVLPSSLTELICNANLITSLPTLPGTLTKLRIDTDKITCLPNSIIGLQVYNANNTLITTPPVCNSCTSPPVATGATICAGNSVTLTATGCTGAGKVLKWYRATTNALVAMPVSPIINTDYYAKCETTTNGSTCVSANSNTVTVTINGATLLPVISYLTPSINNPVPINSIVTFRANATGTAPMTVKWQRRGPSEAIFSDINGTSQTYLSNTDATYTTDSLKIFTNGVSYRAVFGSTCGNVPSPSSIIALAVSQPNGTSSANLQRVKYSPSLGQGGNVAIGDMEYSEKYGLAVAGDFDYWGINTGSLAKFDNNSDTPDVDFPRIYNRIDEVISDGADGWFISGISSRNNLDPRFSINETDEPDYNLYSLIHILPNKKVDRNFKIKAHPNYPIDLSVSGIKKIVLKGGILYAYGDFNNGLDAVTNIIAINSITGNLIPFPKLRGSGDMINVGDKLIFSASSLNTLKDSLGNIFNGLAAIDINSLTVSEVKVNQNIPDFFAHGPLVESNGKLVVRFQHNNLTAQAKLAVFDTMSVVPTWQVDFTIQSFTGHLAADSNTLYKLVFDSSLGPRDFLIEAFDIMTGQSKVGWNIQNFRFRSTQSSTLSHSTSISIGNNKLFISGGFDKVNEQSVSNVAIIDLGTNTLVNWNPEINGTVNRIKALNSSTFLLGPSPLLIKSKQRKQIAFLNPISQELTATQLSIPTLTNGLSDIPTAIAYHGDTLWVAAYSGGSSRIYGFNLIAKEQINFPSMVVNGIIRKMIVRDHLIYVQGDFSNVNVTGQSIERKGIVVFSNTGTVQPFSIDINPSLIDHIKIHDNLVYLKGRFNSVNGIVRNWFASVNRVSGALSDWNPDVVFPYQIDLYKPFEIIGNDIVFNGTVTRIGSWNNTGNNTFFVNRITGTLSKALQKGYGQTATTFESVAKEKYVFISFDNQSPCNGTGTGTTYWDVEKLQYAPKCISTGVDNYNYARVPTFAGDKLFAVWTCSGCGKHAILMQTTFPQGFFQSKVDYFPKVGNNAGSTTVHFYSYDIGYGTKVRLLKAGQPPIIAEDSSSVYPDQFTLQTVFNLSGKAIGNWDIEITFPNGQKATVPSGFKINPPTPAEIGIRLVLPTSIRSGRPTKTNLIISNLGEIDAFVNPVWLFYSKDLTIRMPVEVSSEANSITVDSIYKSSVNFIGGTLFNGYASWVNFPKIKAGESLHIPLSMTTTAATSTTIGAFGGKPMSGCYDGICPDDYNFLKLIPPALVCTKEHFQDGLESFLGLAGGGLGNLAAILSKYSRGQNPGTAQDVLGSINDQILKRIGGETAENLLKARDAIADMQEQLEQGLPTPCDPFRKPRKWDKNTIPIINSQDPNDKLGPVGVHSQRYITGNEPIPYLIRFENYASATAAAQYVKVLDTLDVNKFDFSTFQFGYFNVADTNFYAPPGKKKYLRDWDLRPSKNLILRMEADFNDTTGVLSATYTSLDPATMEWTEDPILGFLPPNVTAPQGEGSVFFSVSPKTSLAHGTQISNKAHIYFDYNPVIPTPPWTNTLDKIIPTSQVQNLPAVSNDTTLVLHWGGSDVGAGTRLYDVYVAVNNNPYKLLVTNTGLTTINFKGKPDSTYKFYSVAVDSVGNEESAPVTFDTQTTIQFAAISLIQSVQSGDWNNPGTWDCHCVPSATQNVIIKSDHKVTLTPAMGSQSCKNLTVESGAVFDAKGVFLADPR